MQSRLRTAVIAGGLVAAVAALPTAADAASGGVTVHKVSVRPDGKALTYGGLDGAISEDGKHVAFQAPSEFGTTDKGGKLYVRHLSSGRVESVCTSATGEAANRKCEHPVLSAHGRFVAFSSTATNLVPGDTNKKLDAFVKDLRSGKIRRVSTTPTGAQIATASYLTSMSSDATKVVFTSAGMVDPAHPPVPDPGDPGKFYAQIYVKNLTSGAVTPVSATADGTFGDDLSEEAEGGLISPDGGTVAFRSRADNFGDRAPYATGIYVKNLKTGALTSLGSLLKLTLPKYNYLSDYSAPSRGGTRIAFSIGIDKGEENAVKVTDNTGVLVADLRQGKVIRVVTTRSGKRAHHASSPVLSADGKRVAFSYANDLVAGDKDNGSDTFVETISSGTIRRLSASTRSGGDAQYSGPTSISADGTAVLFTSEARYLLTKKEPNNNPDVFVARF